MEQWSIKLLGDGGVGKTSLFNQVGLGTDGYPQLQSFKQFILNIFIEPCAYGPTIDDVYRKEFVVDDRMCFVDIIDTDDQEYPGLRDAWPPQPQAFILVYSIASQESFDRLDSFYHSVRKASRENPIFILVGNKSDKVHEREVSKDEGATLARRFGCDFFETSAKIGQNVDQVFSSLVRELRQTRGTYPVPASKGAGVGRESGRKRRCIIM